MAGSYFDRNLPQNFEKMVGAAFLRLLGNSQKETAKAIGISERTIRRWEARAEWAKATREAEKRWAKNIDGKMRRAMEATVAQLPEDIRAGSREAIRFLMWYAERVWPQFAPPARKLQAELLEREQYLVGAIPPGLLRNPQLPEDENGI